MMEQPMNINEHNNAGEPKVVSADKVSSPIQAPAPDMKPEVGTIKPTDKSEINADDITETIDLNESIISEAKNSKTPPETSSRSRKSVQRSEELVMESPMPMNSDQISSHTYVTYSTGPTTTTNSSSFKDTVGTVKDVLGRWGKKVGEATRKAEDLAGNTWQHLKTSPSLADAALGRIAQGTKIIAEGGYEKVFRHTFETVPEEQLTNSFACYLSTSAGPVMGVLYVSTSKLAFCSDNPLSYQAGDKTEWSYYKVVIPLHQLKAVNPSTSRTNSAEKYIQVISVDNHEFWYMGFLNYTGAVTCLQETLQARDDQYV